jgi:hypothetical protein
VQIDKVDKHVKSFTKTDWLALILVLIFFISGVITLPEYGLSWDEGLGNMFFGERYVRYWSSFSDKYLDFKTDLDYHTQTPIDLSQSTWREFPHVYPPFFDTVSAASMHLLSYKLNLLDPVDAFHFPSIAISALLLWLLYLFAARYIGRVAALFSLLMLAGFPRFWGDMHFNPKDVPVAALSAFTIFAYLAWFQKPTLPKAVGVGLVFTAALATKANAAFVPVILLLGVLPWRLDQSAWLETLRHFRQRIGHYILMGISSVGAYFAVWPYLHRDPSRVVDYFRYIASQGERDGGTGINLQPLRMALATMPETMLLFLLIGIIVLIISISLRKDQSIWRRVLLTWLFIPIFRISLPGMVNFDGIRHFLEFLPAAALIAGLGAAALVDWLSARLPGRRRLITTIAAGLIIVNISYIFITFHPFEHLYFNRFVGGINGAAEKFEASETSDYWAVSYRQGVRWLNDNALPNSILYIPIADHLVRLPGALWLRSDIVLTSHEFADSLWQSQQPVYVMFITHPYFYDDIARYCTEKLEPLHSLTVEGKPVTLIYRLETP